MNKNKSCVKCSQTVCNTDHRQLEAFTLMKLALKPPRVFPLSIPDVTIHSEMNFFFSFFWPHFLLSNSLFCVCDLFLSIPGRYAFHSQSDYFSPCQLTLPSPVIPPSIFNVMFFFPPLPSLLLVAPAELLLSPGLPVFLFVRGWGRDDTLSGAGREWG